MNKFVEGYKVRYAQLYGGVVVATVTKVTDTHVTLTESWTAEDTGETVYEDTTYEKHTDDKGEYVTVWEYHGEECNIYGEEDKKMQVSEKVVNYMVQILVKQLRYYARHNRDEDHDYDHADELDALADAIEQGTATGDQYMDAIEICSVV